MHILIIPSEEYVPADYPLSGIFQQDQAQALRRAGCRVGVITPQLRVPVSWKFARAVFPPGFHQDDDLGMPVLRHYGYYLIPGVDKYKMSAWLRAGQKLFKRYIDCYGSPDLVHAHNALYAGILACMILDEWGMPFILTEHSSTYAQGEVSKTLLPYIQEAFSNASKRIVVSPGLGRMLDEVVGECASGWEVVPNILSYTFEHAAPAITNLKINREFTFFNAAGLIEIKGHADLLKAFASAFREEKDVRLRIAGGGPLMKQLRVLAEQLGIEEQVFFLGEIKRSDVLAEMLDSDIYVHPSHVETFGVAIVEALACGKSVVSTSTDGAKYLLNDQNGIIVPIMDIPAFAAALRQTRLNYLSYDGHRIRNQCIQQFGEKAIVNRLTSIYNDVISRREAGSSSR